MKTLFATVVTAAVLSATSAFAADLAPILKAPPAAPPSPWDIAFGGALMSDYNFRGISQSDRGFSGTAYIEGRYNVNANWQLYAGSQYWAVDLPTHPSCECDFYGGVRPTFGPVAFDFGGIYYYYPRERQVFLDATGAATFVNTGVPWTLKDTDFWEVYGKVTWEVLKDRFAVGANVFYSPSWLNSDADGLYASVTAKATLPSFQLPLLGGMKEIGWYLSGELGHYWLGTTNPTLGSVNLPDYWTWNVGLAFTQGVFTLDLRYYDTDASQAECFILTGDLRGLTGGTNALGTSKWCNAAFIVTSKFDLTALTNIK